MNRAVHICVFTGTRVELGPGPTMRCEMNTTAHFSSRSTRCSKTATGGAIYPWGGMALCPKHLDEECGSATEEAP